MHRNRWAMRKTWQNTEKHLTDENQCNQQCMTFFGKGLKSIRFNERLWNSPSLKVMARRFDSRQARRVLESVVFAREKEAGGNFSWDIIFFILWLIVSRGLYWASILKRPDSLWEKYPRQLWKQMCGDYIKSSGPWDNHRPGHLPAMQPDQQDQTLQQADQEGDGSCAKPAWTWRRERDENVCQITGFDRTQKWAYISLFPPRRACKTSR